MAKVVDLNKYRKKKVQALAVVIICRLLISNDDGPLIA